MDVALLIRERLVELGLGQRELAAAAGVTESYISQLLTRKKAPPVALRTGLYERIGEFLRLPAGELARMAAIQRAEEMRSRATAPPVPLLPACRDLLLFKCKKARRAEVTGIFAKAPFGELERLVTQRILRELQAVVREEKGNEKWLRMLARARSCSYKQICESVEQFLVIDEFQITQELAHVFFGFILSSWDIQLKTFTLDIVVESLFASARVRRFEFVERPSPPPLEPGFKKFLAKRSLSRGATAEEIEQLRSLRFNRRRPTAIYYYRELQSLRDPLHFRSSN